MWPRAYTVSPHVYMRTVLPSAGTKSSSVRVRVLNRRTTRLYVLAAGSGCVTTEDLPSHVTVTSIPASGAPPDPAGVLKFSSTAASSAAPAASESIVVFSASTTTVASASEPPAATTYRPPTSGASPRKRAAAGRVRVTGSVIGQ